MVAAKDGTDKCIAARRFPRTVLVKPSWLMECYWSMSRRRSLSHLLTPIPAAALTTSAHVPKSATFDRKDEDDSSGDEDDLAAALEEELLNDS